MAKIIGFERHEYHIEAEGKSPARDFVGFKVHLSAPVDPNKGIGETSMVYPVSADSFSAIFRGHGADELPNLVGQEVLYELSPSGKKMVLSSVILLSDFIKSQQKAVE